jgi:hypothetical protein
MMLNIPENILKRFYISTILIRQEYIIALEFAILIARGCRPSMFKHHRKIENDTPEIDELLPESSPNPTMQLNPFLSPSASDPNVAGAVAIVGHPGIGILKTI